MLYDRSFWVELVLNRQEETLMTHLPDPLSTARNDWYRFVDVKTGSDATIGAQKKLSGELRDT